MGQPAESAVEIRAFQGMSSNTDPHDLRPGQSAKQVNVAAVKLGELNVRRGLKELVYDSSDA